MPKRTKILAAIIAVVAMLFAQFAVAMHSCVTIKSAMMSAAVPLDQPAIVAHQDCHSQVETIARSALCKTHCEADEQSHVTANVDLPVFVAPYILRLQHSVVGTPLASIEAVSPVDSPPPQRNRVLRI